MNLHGKFFVLCTVLFRGSKRKTEELGTLGMTSLANLLSFYSSMTARARDFPISPINAWFGLPTTVVHNDFCLELPGNSLY